MHVKNAHDLSVIVKTTVKRNVSHMNVACVNFLPIANLNAIESRYSL